MPLDRVWCLAPLPWTGYIISSETILIRVWTRPTQVMAARLLSSIKQSRSNSVVRIIAPCKNIELNSHQISALAQVKRLQFEYFSLLQVNVHKGPKDVRSDRDVDASTSVMKSLSGGERSVSTVCFLTALWGAMESPFRCLDEFDVFMVCIK